MKIEIWEKENESIVPSQNLAHGLTMLAQPSGEKAARPTHAGGTTWAHPRAVTAHPTLLVVRLRQAHRRCPDGKVTWVSTTEERATRWTTLEDAKLTRVAIRQ
jgi:hypothetical protein